MAHLNHAAAYQELREQVLKGIGEHFPVNGKIRSLSLDGLSVRDEDLGSDDIEGQKEAKLAGHTWSAPVYASLKLTENSTGKVLDSQTIRVAEIPKVTRRHSFIIDGQEYQVANQWQLKPGAYVRRKQTGELETQFNIAGKPPFKLTFEPDTKRFLMERGSSSAIPLYSILRATGVDDGAIEQMWGKEIFDANRTARGVNTALERFYRADKGSAPADSKVAHDYVIDALSKSELRPDATQITLGKPFSHVSGEALASATAKMLKVHNGAPEDDRDSLVFKDLRSAADYAHAKLTHWKTKRDVLAKMSRKINFADTIRDVVKFDMLNSPLKATFTNDSLSSTPSQTNPVEMLSNAQQTTVMGEGGIQRVNQVNDEVKFVNPSHLGFLDPIHTPESEKTGVVLHLPLGVQKVGRQAKVPLYNLETKKTELVGPELFMSSKVVLPDQVTWKNGEPTPRSGKVQMSTDGNKLIEDSFKSAQYVMRHPSQLFDIASNLIPFLGNNSGNRATYATHHIQQAVSLNERDAPLVMVGTGSTKPGLDTFEALLGRQSGHPAPVGGTVSKVTRKAVTIRDEKGKQHAVQLYDNFPLNDPKAVLHSTPTVAVGDKVEAGETVADTNFMKNGKLALGRNLRVAYVPFKGYNFEDGVVLSETAAKKLSSLHLHKPSIMVDDQLVMNPRKFSVHHPGAFSREQLASVGEDGVVRVGTRVEAGDPLVVAMRPYQLKDRMGLGAIRRSLSGQHSDVSLRWESDYPGEVVDTSRDRKGQLTVHVRSIEPMQIGDKIAGRHGNKGIVSMILPDKEMPHTKDGKHIEVALNPSGIPGRINVGQVLETAAAKIAEKTKKPYIVDNFDHGDALARIKDELKQHGLTDTEELHDPVTGVSLGKALVGPQYMLKLTHQIDKKIAARAGMGLPGGVGEPERYDVNLMPASGGKTGGQRLDPLTLNVMLAHGARANIREAQTWKSEGADPQTNESKRWPSQHTEVWTAIQSGTPIPLPRPTFAFQKFTDMLRASGINIEKKGQTFQLSPMTDKQILSMSNGALPRPIMLTKSKLDKNGEPEPYPGGLFDPQITGGHGGKKWSHIKLSEPVPNPIFEGAIRGILGLTTKQYSDLVDGEHAVTKKGEIVPLGTAGSLTGGHAIKHLLDQVNVEKELEETKAKLTSTVKAKGVDAANVDKMVKKVKHLQALDRIGVKPADAYVLSNLPVIPPVMRPVSMLPGGKIRWADLNGLYAKFAQVNQELGDPEIRKTLPESRLKSLRADMYDGVRAIVGVGTAGGSPGKQRGFLEQISGSAPKFGYFQRTLMNRRQDLSMRSVIVPEPALGLDEVGIPEKKASTLFRPFVVRKMVEIGSAANPLEAQELIKKETKSARRALELVMQERPVILKRDPALHKHSALAFTPKLVSGRAIQIHPLVTSGFNADFDGDTMSAYVPISRDAVDEARKMYPSNNLFNEATGKIMYQPTLESALGLYKLSLVKDGKTKHFSAPVDALKAVQTRTLDVNHPITVGSMKTTAGRLLLADALPEPMRDAVLKGTEPIDKKGLDKLFTVLAKNHSQDFGTAANRLKDLGNGMSFGAIEVRHPNTQGPTAIMAKESPGRHLQFLPVGTHTLSLDDFKADKASRDPVFNRAHQEADALDNLNISGKERDRRTIDIWKRAGKEVEDAHRVKIQKDPTNLSIMQMAGVKPSWDQYKQMVIAPVLVTDASGAIVPRPITRSYSEGLGVGDYWTQMSGARRGNVMKVQEVSEPGALSKRFVASAMNLVITGHDCGTHQGVALPASSNDVHDRILAHDFSAKGLNVPAGTMLSPDVVTKIRTADKNASLVVRSPLKCEHGAGLCQKCAGLAPTGKFYELGTNTGLLAAQSLGERSVQVTLKAFHSGGVVSSGGHQVTDDFTRILQLTELPTNIPDSAVLAHAAGTVKKIEKDATGVKVHVGDHSYHVGKDRYGRGLHENLPRAPELPGYKPWSPPKVGDKVEAGQQLTDPNRTLINPHDLYKATKSMDRVHSFLTDELHGIYAREGVRRQHIETIVKAIGNLTKVRDPGDAENILPGEFQPYSKVRAMNVELVKAGKKPIEHVPVLKGVEVLPLSVQEDWMAKLQHNNLRATLQDAASTAGISYLHGLHPVPGIAYGAEFGLTSDHAKRPGLEHLKNVPAYSY